MRNERELISEISRIGHESKRMEDAVYKAQSLLQEEIGSSTLLLDSAAQGISPWAAKIASEFLESRKFPFRALYTAPLSAGDETAGRLIACFGSFGSPGEHLERLTRHIAQQFGPLFIEKGFDQKRREVQPRPDLFAPQA